MIEGKETQGEDNGDKDSRRISLLSYHHHPKVGSGNGGLLPAIDGGGSVVYIVYTWICCNNDV